MAYCYDKAIPHSHFLDQWTEEDRAKLMAYAIEKSLQCQMCGTSPYEWLEDRYAYVPVHEVCFGCQQKDLLRDDEEKKPSGSSVVLIPRREHERREHARQKGASR